MGFIRDAWYMAGWSQTIADKPVAFTMLDSPASNLLLDQGTMAPGEPRDTRIHPPGAPILTPETVRTTQYFGATGRDSNIADKALTARIFEIVDRVSAQEDKPIIAATQRNMERTGARFVNFTKGDAGPAMIRREIDRQIALEAEQTLAQAEAPPVREAV